MPGAGLNVNGSDVLNTSDSFNITGTRNYVSSGSVNSGGQAGTLVALGNSGSIGTNHELCPFLSSYVLINIRDLLD